MNRKSVAVLDVRSADVTVLVGGEGKGELLVFLGYLLLEEDPLFLLSLGKPGGFSAGESLSGRLLNFDAVFRAVDIDPDISGGDERQNRRRRHIDVPDFG